MMEYYRYFQFSFDESTLDEHGRIHRIREEGKEQRKAFLASITFTHFLSVAVVNAQIFYNTCHS
jgi:hypothetical protein